MTYKIVFLDIDGTTFNDKKEILDSTVEAVGKLKKNGIEVAIATGRPPYQSKDVMDKLKIDTCINFNGSYILYKGEVVFKEALQRDSVKRMYEEVQKKNHCITYQGENHHFTTDPNHIFYQDTFKNEQERIPSLNPLFFKSEDTYQIWLHCTEEFDHEYCELFPEFEFVRWGNLATDVFPKGSSKALGIERLLSILKIEREDAVAFGDGLNDMEMLQFVGMGVAMGNGHEELKKVANFVTDSCNNDGIKKGLEKLGLL